MDISQQSEEDHESTSKIETDASGEYEDTESYDGEEEGENIGDGDGYMHHNIMEGLRSFVDNMQEAITGESNRPQGHAAVRNIMERFGHNILTLNVNQPTMRTLTDLVNSLDQYDEELLVNNIRKFSEYLSIQGELVSSNPSYYHVLKASLSKLKNILEVFSYNGEILLLACQCVGFFVDESLHESHPRLLEDEMIGNGNLLTCICKLLSNVEYIDVTEQAILLLDKLADDYSSSILKEGALLAALSVMDFFPLRIQQHALSIALKLSGIYEKETETEVSREDQELIDTKLQEIIPFLKGLLSHYDSQIVQSSCLCLSNIVSHVTSRSGSPSTSCQAFLCMENIKEVINILADKLTAMSTSASVTSMIKLLYSAVKQSPHLYADMLKSNIINIIISALNGHIPHLKGWGSFTPIRKPLENIKYLLELLIFLLPPISESSLLKFGLLPKQVLPFDNFTFNPFALGLALNEEPAILDKIKTLLSKLVMFMRNPLNRTCYSHVFMVFLQLSNFTDHILALFTHTEKAQFYSALCRVVVIFDVKSIILLLEICQLSLHLPKERPTFEAYYFKFGLVDLIRSLLATQSDTLTAATIRESLRQSDVTRQSLLNEFPEDDFESIAGYLWRETRKVASLFKGLELTFSPEVQGFVASFNENALNPNSKTLREFFTWFKESQDLSGYELYKSGLLSSMCNYLICPNANGSTHLAHFMETCEIVSNVGYLDALTRFIEKCQCLIRHGERLPLFVSSHVNQNQPLNVLKALTRPVRIRFAEIMHNADSGQSTPLDVELSLSPIATLKSLEAYLGRLKNTSVNNATNQLLVNRHLASSVLSGLSVILPEAEEQDEEAELGGSQTPQLPQGDSRSPGVEIEFYFGTKKLSKRATVYQIVSAIDMSIGRQRSTLLHRSFLSSPLANLTEQETRSDHELENPMPITNPSPSSATYQLWIKFTPPKNQPVSPVSTAPLSKILDNQVDFFVVIMSELLKHANANEPVQEEYFIRLAKELLAVSPSESLNPAKSFGVLLIHYIHTAVEYGPQMESKETTRGFCHVQSALSPYFVNDVLSIKAIYQVQGPACVSSGIVPDWMRRSLRTLPYFFIYSVKADYSRAYLMGLARSLTFLQDIYSSAAGTAAEGTRRSIGRGELNVYHDESEFKFGRMKRLRMKVSRERVLHSASLVFEYATAQGHEESILEIEFHSEVGTGLGPTLEFYSLVAKALKQKMTQLWHHTEHGGEEVDDHNMGLYLRPRRQEKGEWQKHLTLIGMLMAKALLDHRTIDLNLNTVLLDVLLGRPVLNSLRTLSLIDPKLASSLSQVRDMGSTEWALFASTLDAHLPGYPEIKASATKEEMASPDTFIQFVLKWFLKEGVEWQIRVIQESFQRVFPSMNSLFDLFTPSEFTTFLCGDRLLADWKEEDLAPGQVILTDHGYTFDSPVIKAFVATLAGFNYSQRKDFCLFITGSTTLPAGGLKSLKPRLTVVRKTCDEPHNADTTVATDQMLPSVMTCANYLKLPNYSSQQVLNERLLYAMKEGQAAFYLS